MHTNLGDGWISPARLVETATRRQLTVIAVTDHDHIEGARRVEELLAQRDSAVQMITGVEVSTRHGHLLGLFVKKAPRPLRPAQESIDAIKEQGGPGVLGRADDLAPVLDAPRRTVDPQVKLAMPLTLWIRYGPLRTELDSEEAAHA
jgi:predicted metal-dependent phosphoesterase TrpH